VARSHEWQEVMKLWPPQIISTIQELSSFKSEELTSALKDIEERPLHDKPYAQVWEAFTPLIRVLFQTGNEGTLTKIILAINTRSSTS